MNSNSIRTQALLPIKRLFKVILVVGVIGIVSISVIRLIKAKHDIEVFVVNFVIQTSQASDIDNQLLSLQKNLDHFLDVFEISSTFSAFVSIELSGRIIAESGRLNNFKFPMHITKYILLPSGSSVQIRVIIDAFNLIWRTAISELAVLSLFLLSIQILKFRIEDSIEKIVTPIEDLARSVGKAANPKTNVETQATNENDFIEIQSLKNSINSFIFEMNNSQEQILHLKKSEVFGNIARQVAHDIRSPLSALRMLVPLFEDSNSDRIDLVKSAIDRISDISDDLLEKGKKNAIQAIGFQSVERSDLTKIDEVVKNILSEKKLLKSNQEIDFEYDFRDGQYSVPGSSKEIARIISNLIDNSIESFDPNSAGKKVVISIRKTGSWVVLAIKDNGKGIPSEVLDRIGQYGFSHGKETNKSGSGLGVYHAKSYIESIGGNFTIISQVSEGTIVQISFKV